MLSRDRERTLGTRLHFYDDILVPRDQPRSELVFPVGLVEETAFVQRNKHKDKFGDRENFFRGSYCNKPHSDYVFMMWGKNTSQKYTSTCRETLIKEVRGARVDKATLVVGTHEWTSPCGYSLQHVV